ncbi:MAG: aldehyde ferredoxin oxidoreductase C-terminal domain-containing protein [candidate division WOR-3 bacterium]
MKIIRVDMTNLKVSYQDVPNYYNDYAGRGLIAKIMNDEVDPKCDPLGPENKLILAPGMFCGTTLVNTSRISIGCKGPLTNTIKESNVGGTIGSALGKHAIKAIIFEGQPLKKGPFIFHLSKEGKAEIIEAPEVGGLRTYEFARKIFSRYGEDNSLLCIGPAGENLMKIASIQSTDVDKNPCRAAGRGGVGAAMGSKHIKGIVVEHRADSLQEFADKSLFDAAAKRFAKAVMEHPFSSQLLPALGTAGLVGPVNAMGAFPSLNARIGVFEKWERISGEKLREIIEARKGNPTHLGCSQCIIHCSNQYLDRDGSYLTGSLEYETIWAMGAMTGIDDLDIIAQLDRLSDEIGVDTMSMGVAIAVAMDAGYRSFGDTRFALEVLEEVANNTEMGNIMGDGPLSVGRHFKNPRVPVVKGQSIAAYDPRAMQGNAVTYATSPMGADHTAGNVIGEYMSGRLDPLKPDGQVDASKNAQIAMAAVDSTGLCLFASFALLSPEGAQSMLDLIKAKTGKIVDENTLGLIGIETLRLERAFNRAAGFTAKDDRLPEFFYREPLPPHNTVVLIKDEDLAKALEF